MKLALTTLCVCAVLCGCSSGGTRIGDATQRPLFFFQFWARLPTSTGQSARCGDATAAIADDKACSPPGQDVLSRPRTLIVPPPVVACMSERGWTPQYVVMDAFESHPVANCRSARAIEDCPATID